MLEALGFAVYERFFEIEPALIIDIVIEIDVDPRRGVIQKEPSGLGNSEFVGFGVHENGPDAERGFRQAFDRIV